MKTILPEVPAPGTPARPVPRAVWLAFLVLPIALTFLSFHRVLTYGLTDVDTLMNVHEARVESGEDAIGQLGKKLTGGRAGENANFYRPTLMLVYAGLRGVSGWNPFGYHLFDLLLHALNGLLLGLFVTSAATRLAHSRPVRLGLTAMILFVIHPLGVETVPAIARNGDLVVTALFLAALLVLDRVEARLAKGEAAALPGIAARLVLFYGLFALTIGAKDPGMLLLIAAPFYVLLVRTDLPRGRRFAHAITVMLPCVPIAAVYLIVRARVLEEAIGGYHSDIAFLWMVKHLARGMLVELTIPGYAFDVQGLLPKLSRRSWLDLAWVVVAGGATVGVVLGLRRRAREAGRSVVAKVRSDLSFLALSPTGKLLGLALGIVAMHAGLFVLADVYHRRLVYTIVAFWSVVPAVALLAAIDHGRSLRGGGFRFSHIATLLVLVWAALFVWQSPLRHPYDEWRSSGETARLLTEAVRDEWSRLPANARVYLVNVPIRFSYEPMRRSFTSKFSTTHAQVDYSLQAWLDDQFPEKNIRLVQLGNGTWVVPVDRFRHECRSVAGWLVFNTPPLMNPYELNPRRTGALDGTEKGFRSVELGPGRRALSYPGEAPTGAYVLVFDGNRPHFEPLAGLTGHTDPADLAGAPGG